MANRPTLVFIPGAWHLPTCHNKIIDLLETRYGFECDAITLPSISGSAEATFKNDLDTARAAITKHISRGQNVVVIAHSYGGIVANSAIKGLTSATGTPTDAHVTGLILIASAFTLTGLIFMAYLFDRPPPSWRADKTTGFAELVVPPSSRFYTDLSAPEAQHHISQLRPQSMKSLSEGWKYAYAGWRDASWCLYLGTLQDPAMPLLLQRMNVGMARAMGIRKLWHVEVDSGYSPFLSRPEEVVEVILAAIEGHGSGEGKVSNLREKISEPKVEVVSPSSWVKFGLPLVFGMIIGKAIIAFEWFRGFMRK